MSLTSAPCRARVVGSVIVRAVIVRAVIARTVVAPAVALAAGLLVLQPGEARACSCAEPSANELRVGEGIVPSNAAGVPWWFPTNRALAPVESFVQLERWEGEELRPVTAQLESVDGLYLIRPAEPWSEGERYRISIDVGATNAPPEERFRVAEFEVGAPLEGGALTLSAYGQQRGELVLVDRGGSCAGSFDVDFVDVGTSSELEIPRGLLSFTTYVDGQRWQPIEALCQTLEPGTSWTGRGSDRVVAACDGTADSTASLEIGRHTVRIEARLPGTDVVLSSNELSVGLFCRERVVGETPGGNPLAALPPGSRGEAPMAADPSAGAVARPEGSAEPASNTMSGSPALAAASSGGCALSGKTSGGWMPAATLLGLALASLRRRSRPLRR